MAIKDHPASLLLLEGNDDFHVIHALCKQSGVPIRNLENPTGGNFSAIDCKGVDQLIEQIRVRFKSSPLIKTVGVIIDADANLNARWQSLQDEIRNVGFNPPNDFPQTGLIIQHNDLRFGAWIMPDNNVNGMLEDFISFLVPPNDLLMPIAHSALQNIEQQSLNKYQNIHRAKALIHTWLAWQEDPGTPLGQAITKKYLDANQAVALSLIQWLANLFI